MKKSKTFCAHCPHNDEAKQPIAKMEGVDIGAAVFDKIVSAGKDPSCLLCETLKEISDTFQIKN